MTEINILDSSVFNRIAAGEVVENPRSIVKELVENSIDSGADTISVEIRGGGIEFISVTDNGKGISGEDMPIAFMSHATSKIKDIKDLETIGTLGFRGEALPSIASVAEVEMLSRKKEVDLGNKIILHNGKITDSGECGASLGTKVTVRNLFANVPARAKFLRKPVAEEGAVTELITKFILANPYIKIKYTVDNKILLQSDGNGVESAIFNVYNSDFLQSLSPILYSMPDISISGYIGKPHFTKHNRNYQTLIVNGRYVVNSEISYCIQQCYQNYLMKRQFPVYILYLNLPADMIDVNVHPNKLDVRFANEKRLKSIIYNLIKTQIDNLALAPIEFVAATQVEPKLADKDSPQINVTTFNDSSLTPRNDNNFANVPIAHNHIERRNISETGAIASKINSFIRADFNKSDNKRIPLYTEEISFDFLKNEETKYAGKLFNTYILVEGDNCVYIIDQHAAHEKLLYDKLIAQLEEKEQPIQDLLIPFIFEVSPEEKALLSDKLEEINDCGFKIDPLSGNSYALYALPACCADLDLKKFVTTILTDIETKKTSSEFIKEDLMQAACKSAIKGEMDLSENEINSLLKQMKQTNSAKFCPHGRPIIIKYPKNDLEKLFKRI